MCKVLEVGEVYIYIIICVIYIYIYSIFEGVCSSVGKLSLALTVSFQRRNSEIG